jgi:hypothetical protein
MSMELLLISILIPFLGVTVLLVLMRRSTMLRLGSRDPDKNEFDLATESRVSITSGTSTSKRNVNGAKQLAEHLSGYEGQPATGHQFQWPDEPVD